MSEQQTLGMAFCGLNLPCCHSPSAVRIYQSNATRASCDYKSHLEEILLVHQLGCPYHQYERKET